MRHHTLVVILALGACKPREALRVGTYNIRNLGAEPTDLERLARVIVDAHPAALALQEVVDASALDALEARLAAHRAPRFAHVLSRCGGARTLRVGFLYDAARVTLERSEEFPGLAPGGDGACDGSDRAGLAATFRAGARRFQMLALHLAAGSEPERVARRRDQWGRALAIARRLRARDQLPLLVLGDVNSTGWLDDAGGERSFVLGAAADAGFTVPTADLACTEFWRSPRGRFEPSVLDHTLVAGLTPPKATVHGYCARLACRPHPLDEPTAEYATVSDHCPVTLDLPP